MILAKYFIFDGFRHLKEAFKSYLTRYCSVAA